MDNPYAAPAPGSRPRTGLTKVQKASLQLYARHRGKKVGLGTVFKALWKQYAMLLLAFVAVIALCAVRPVELSPVYFMLIGYFGASLLASINMNRKFCELWPALDAVLDYDRVEEVLEHGVPRSDAA